MGRRFGSVPWLPNVAAMSAGGVWYLAGGVSAANCVAAYQPKGAASLAASYINLANPGTYDATAPTAAPTFAAATGWTFNGSAQYLTTGVVPAANYSMIIRYSDGTDAVNTVLAGAFTNPYTVPTSCMLFYIHPWNAPDYAIFANGQYVIGTADFTSGVLAIAGPQGYANGAPHGATIGAWVGTAAQAITIGARNSNGTVNSFCPCKMQALAIYNVALTAPQVLAITTAMQSL